jgi:hypothetical protein
VLMTLNQPVYGSSDNCKVRQSLRTLEHDPFLFEGKSLLERHHDQLGEGGRGNSQLPLSKICMTWDGVALGPVLEDQEGEEVLKVDAPRGPVWGARRDVGKRDISR